MTGYHSCIFLGSLHLQRLMELVFCYLLFQAPENQNIDQKPLPIFGFLQKPHNSQSAFAVNKDITALILSV